jgi:LacI family transcriptional regulator
LVCPKGVLKLRANKDINSNEIARLAGVSRSTVSRVINNYPNVPPETRQKVMKIIEQYNYFPNISAQVLAGKKAKSIGVFLVARGHVSSDVLTNLLITSVIEGASDCGYYAVTNIIRDIKDTESIKTVKEMFFQRRIDGGIFIGTNNHEPLIEELIAEGFIVGVVDQDLPGRLEPNRVVFNVANEEGSVQAVDYLVSLNHRNIGVINGDLNRYAGPSKFQGFMKGMKKHGLTIHDNWVLPGDFSVEGGYHAAQILLKKSKQLPTALFAANDSTAFGAMRAFEEHSIRIPEDISIIGFDDHTLSQYVKPALTTIRVEFAQMMKDLSKKLIEVIECEAKNPIIKVKVSTKLLVRESCKPNVL